MPVPVAARSKAWVCDRSLADSVDSNPAGGVSIFVSAVCCQIQVSAAARSLVQSVVCLSVIVKPR
jgi:hypothetical protein